MSEVRVDGHTPGRLTVSEFSQRATNAPFCDLILRLEHGTYSLARVSYPTTTGDTIGAEQRRQNARRLAACWNALANLTTEEIETAKEIEAEPVNRLLAERDALKLEMRGHEVFTAGVRARLAGTARGANPWTKHKTEAGGWDLWTSWDNGWAEQDSRDALKATVAEALAAMEAVMADYEHEWHGLDIKRQLQDAIARCREATP